MKWNFIRVFSYYEEGYSIMSRTTKSSLTNALRILKSFSIDHPELTLSEISEFVGVSKSTACRLIQTLESEGFIYQNILFNTYRLGSSVLTLSNTVIDQLAILKETTYFLKQLTAQTGESSHIAILDNTDVIYLKKEDSHHRVQLLSHIGRRNPAHCTASGQAILAFVKPTTVEKLFEGGLDQATNYSFGSLPQLQQKLATIREQGYSISKGELIENIVSIGAPIYNKNNQVFAAINVAGPKQRILPNLQQIVTNVLFTSKTMTNYVQSHEKDVDIETFIK
ncbi:IclR family transcriptional regulator [Metabacillus sediminilitoris]|uniref:IclR family transcriptional regulator n=2 Tax=Metabacillus sediminilitoris TaxID=2567941 RepID=A0A4S4BTZ8_9BACI|nr:helix-turn-helix domain-containing protein [Metabacillus sediminilitoris]THF78555.1 IclR family transcriptional regulator [Metabacillus sediminilitoris]